MRRLVAALLMVIVCSVPAWAATDKYDRYFERYTRRFFANIVDYQWFKAQAMAESNLNPQAKSPVGAMGLLQLMPFTSRECAGDLGIKNMPWDPESNVMMGIYYMSKMFGFWSAKRTVEQRMELSQASYNAGAGNILKAQRRAVKGGDCFANLWDCIKRFLRLVTGIHSKETIDYVARIHRYYELLRGL